MINIEDIVAEPVLEQAYAWLCHRRRHYPSSADIWEFRRHWPAEKARLRHELGRGQYRCSLLTRVTNRRLEAHELWAPRDALVLKALAVVASTQLPASPHCYHLQGHGGGKGAVRAVLEHLPKHRFVLKTDVKSYYASIDHHRLLDRLAAWIRDRRVMNLIGQYLKRIVEQGGHYWEPQRGIALGCPLSPIMGAVFLAELDARLAGRGFRIVRFMDDILVLAPTRWKLRKAVTIVNQGLTGLGLMKHPAKTFIGKIEKGFDFLGYHFSPEGLTVALKTVEQFVARARRLYERERGRRHAARLGAYVRRWNTWVRAGVGTLNLGGTIEGLNIIPPSIGFTRPDPEPSACFTRLYGLV